MSKEIEIKELVELVNEINEENPINWKFSSVDQQTTIYFIANNLLEQYNNTWKELPEFERSLIMLATMTKLVVENLTLNLYNKNENKI